MIDGFDGFGVFDVATPQSTVFGRSGGRGSPVLLLGGMPETHLMWHRVVLRLATRLGRLPAGEAGYADMGRWLIPATWVALAWCFLVMLMMTLPAVNHVAGEYFLYIEGVGVLWFVLVLMRRLRRGDAGPGREQLTEGADAGEVDLSS